MLRDLKRFRKLSGLAFAAIVVLPLLIQPPVAYGANSLSPFRQITHSLFCSFAGLFIPAACNVPEEQLPLSAIDAPEASAARTDDPLPFRAADTELPETNELSNPSIIQPVVERIINTREVVRESGITQEQFEIALNELRKQISSAQAALPATYGAPVARSIPNTWGLTQRIDQLSGVNFSGGTITGTPITNSPISGSTGSFVDFFATNATTTNFFATSLTTLSGFFTDLISFNATFTNATTTDFVATGATTLATTTLTSALFDANSSAGAYGELLTSTGTSTAWGTIGGSSITADSLDWSEFDDAMVLDANTTIDMDTNGADLNFDSNTFVIDSSTNRVGIGTASPQAALHIIGVEQENSTYRGLLIESPVDDNFWGALTIQAGNSANQRRYFEFKDNTGTRTNLMGFNALNSFVVYDAVRTYHPLSADAGSNFRINAAPGNYSVHIGQDAVETGSGGLTVYDGSINASFPANTYGRIGASAIESYNGRYVQAFSPNNNSYTRLFTQDAKSYLRGSQELEISSASNNIIFSNNSYSDEIVFDLDNTRVGIGTMAPGGRLHIYGASAGSVSAPTWGDDLIVETSSAPGISIIGPDTQTGRLIWGSPTDNYLAQVGMTQSTALMQIGTKLSGGEIALETADGSEAMRIDSTGNVGIGTTSPQEILHVSGAGGQILKIESTSSGQSAINLVRTSTSSGDWQISNEGNLYIKSSLNESYGDTRLTILNTGNVGIGTASPGRKLEIYDSAAVGVMIQSNTSYADLSLSAAADLDSILRFYEGSTQKFYLFNDASDDAFQIARSSDNSRLMTIKETGSVGIGTTAPADKLVVAGDIRVGTGTTGCVKDADGTSIAGTCSSDERLKTDIADLPDILDNLVELRPVSYHWNETAADLFSYGTSSTQIGLIAQDVELNLPDLVTEDAEGYKQIRFSDLPIYLLKGMREMWEIVSGNRSDIAALKIEVAALRGQLAISGASQPVAENDNSPIPEPTIELRGNDPANVAINTNYSDLGAIAKDTNGNDLFVSLLLDGDPVEAISLDTSTSSTHIITYSAATQDDIAFEITRTVIIGEPKEIEAEDTDAAEPEATEAGDAADEPNSADIESGDAEENPTPQDAEQEDVQELEEAADEPASTNGENEPDTAEAT